MRAVGKYEMIELLARGGLGEVWKARDTQLGRVVAVKFLQTHGPEETTRFQREGRIVAQLSHPNIAQLYEVVDDPRDPCLVIQYVDGVALDRAALPIADRVRALAQAARAVHYAHESGVIHRDLKPENIFVDRDGRGIVLDFGLARQVKEKSTTSMAGDIIGTPAYMSPEQAWGDVDSLDRRTDVYGLGATLYAVVGGRAPFMGDTPFEIVNAVLTDDPEPPGGEPDLQTICLKAMEKEPDRRYQTALEFAEDLERFLRREPIQARRAGFWYRLKRRVQRQPVVWSLAALLVLSLVGGAVFGVTQLALRLRTETAARRRAEAQALVEKGRGSVEEVRARLYVRGATLAGVSEAFEAARKDFRRAFDVVPDFAPAWYWIGRSYRQEGRLDEAVDALRRAVALDPALASAWRELARAHLERGLERAADGAADDDEKHARIGEGAREALACFKRAGTAAPGIERDVAEAYRLYAADDYASILELVREAKQKYGRVPGMEDLEFIYAITRPRAEEIEHLTHAVEIRPTHVMAIMTRGVSYLELGQLDRALADLDEALRLRPDYAIAHANRAAVLNSMDRFPEALDAFTLALRLRPTDATSLANRAVVKCNLRDYAGALADAEEALRTVPNGAVARLARGIALDGLGRLPEALDDLTRAMELSPRAADPCLKRGNCHKDLGKTPEAMADFDEALRRDPKCAEAHVNRGIILEDQGDLEGALAAFDAATDANPKLPQGFFNRGMYNARRGDLDQALDDLDRALDIKPDYALALMNRASVLDALGRFKDAIADYDAYIDRWPNVPEAYANRGGAWGNLHDQARALADFKKALEVAPKDWPHRARVEGFVRDLEAKLSPDF